MASERPARPPTDGSTQRDIHPEGAGRGLAADAARETTECPAGAMVSARRRLLRLDRQPGTREVHRRYMSGPSRSVSGSGAALSLTPENWIWIWPLFRDGNEPSVP